MDSQDQQKELDSDEEFFCVSVPFCVWLVIVAWNKPLSFPTNSGKPSALYAETHPDWAPTLNLGYDSGVPDELRYARLRQRNARKRPAEQSDETRRP